MLSLSLIISVYILIFVGSEIFGEALESSEKICAEKGVKSRHTLLPQIPKYGCHNKT